MADPTPLLVYTPKSGTHGFDLTGQSFTPVAANASDGNTFPSTGREVIVAQNPDIAPHTVTVTAQPDVDNRHATGDNLVMTIPAGEFQMSAMLPRTGWADTNGLIKALASDASVLLAILRLPA